MLASDAGASVHSRASDARAHPGRRLLGHTCVGVVCTPAGADTVRPAAVGREPTVTPSVLKVRYAAYSVRSVPIHRRAPSNPKWTYTTNLAL